MCFSNPFIAVLLFNRFPLTKKIEERAILLSWPDLIGNVIPVSVFTEPNLH